MRAGHPPTWASSSGPTAEGLTPLASWLLDLFQHIGAHIFKHMPVQIKKKKVMAVLLHKEVSKANAAEV